MAEEREHITLAKTTTAAETERAINLLCAHAGVEPKPKNAKAVAQTILRDVMARQERQEARTQPPELE